MARPHPRPLRNGRIKQPSFPLPVLPGEAGLGTSNHTLAPHLAHLQAPSLGLGTVLTKQMLYEEPHGHSGLVKARGLTLPPQTLQREGGSGLGAALGCAGLAVGPGPTTTQQGEWGRILGVGTGPGTTWKKRAEGRAQAAHAGPC